MKNKELDSKQPKYLEKVKLSFQEKGMLGKFYTWVLKLNRIERRAKE